MRERLTVLGFATFVLAAIVGSAFASGISSASCSSETRVFLAAAADDTFFESDTWGVVRNLAIFFALVFWAATVYWVYKDARRRIEDPWLIAMATLLGAVPPFIGPLIYMLFRPPEYLEDVRERELEILAIEEQLAERDLRCPVCRGDVDPSLPRLSRLYDPAQAGVRRVRVPARAHLAGVPVLRDARPAPASSPARTSCSRFGCGARAAPTSLRARWRSTPHSCW